MVRGASVDTRIRGTDPRSPHNVHITFWGSPHWIKFFSMARLKSEGGGRLVEECYEIVSQARP